MEILSKKIDSVVEIALFQLATLEDERRIRRGVTREMTMSKQEKANSVCPICYGASRHRRGCPNNPFFHKKEESLGEKDIVS